MFDLPADCLDDRAIADGDRSDRSETTKRRTAEKTPLRALLLIKPVRKH
jgi:hypothetical protein